MLTAIFLFWFSVYTYPSFLSSYAENTLKAGSVMVGLIVGSYGFTQMLIRIPLGIISDIIKKRKLFVQLGFVASMIASAGLAVVTMFDGDPHPALAVMTLIFRSMAGVCASTWVAFSVLYSSAYPPEKTGAAMSRMAFPQTGSQVIAMLAGAQLMNYLGEIWAFLLATVAGAAGLVIISMVDDIPRPPAGAIPCAAFWTWQRTRASSPAPCWPHFTSWWRGQRCRASCRTGPMSTWRDSPARCWAG